MLADAGGLRVVASADELAANLIEYFAKPELRLQAVNAGLAVVEANRGALQRQFALAQSLIKA
jgi:3-deoxy-D-manno-octulosonic-acid transferase